MAYSTQYGANRSKFGAADYAAALYPHRLNTTDLQSTRESVLSWLTGSGRSTLGEGQGPGDTGGLYERIRTPELSPWWGDHTLEGRSTRFGHADLDASRAAGFSDLAIQSYLDANPTLLASDNVPGAGGVYDIVAGIAEDTRPGLPHWDNITERRDTIEWTDYEGRTITRDDRPSLKLGHLSKDNLTSRTSLGDPSRRRPATARPKYTKTKDLNRQNRSLTISSY